MATRGVLMYAVNNSHIDYIKLAILNAKCVHKYMGVPVSLITNNDGSYHPDLLETTVFDKVIVDGNSQTTNHRIYRDTIYHSVQLDFKNGSRPSAYDLSPYDETILIDVDYIIQNDTLNHAWGSLEDIMINRDAISVMNKPLQGDEFRLNQFGIRMYWATVIYFKKTEDVQVLFNMVKHIKENWDFYKLVYNFPSAMYRNDHAFSIAIHTLSGFMENTEIKALPTSQILSMTDRDQIYAIRPDSSWLVFANETKVGEEYKFYATSIKGMNVHCMNKMSLLRNIDALEATL